MAHSRHAKEQRLHQPADGNRDAQVVQRVASDANNDGLSQWHAVVGDFVPAVAERSHLHGLVAETSSSLTTLAAAWFAFRRMPHCPHSGGSVLRFLHARLTSQGTPGDLDVDGAFITVDGQSALAAMVDALGQGQPAFTVPQFEQVFELGYQRSMT